METLITTPGGAITLRAGRADDAAAYRELRLEALRDHPDAFSSDYETNLARPMSHWEESLRPDRADRTVMMYFAVHDAELVGMCGIVRFKERKTLHSATIVSMYVRPAWRGYRIGQRLVDACVDWARTQGVQIVKLAVVTTNTPAIRCYTRCGFHVYGIEPQALCHDGVCYDELLMACPA